MCCAKGKLCGRSKFCFILNRLVNNCFLCSNSDSAIGQRARSLAPSRASRLFLLRVCASFAHYCAFIFTIVEETAAGSIKILVEKSGWRQRSEEEEEEEVCIICGVYLFFVICVHHKLKAKKKIVQCGVAKRNKSHT